MTTESKNVVVQGFSEAAATRETTVTGFPKSTTVPETEVKKAEATKAEEDKKETTTATTSTAGKGAGADALAALRAQLGQQAAGHHFHFGDHQYETYSQKGVNFVVAKNGLFRVTVTPVAMFASKIGEAPTANKIPGLADIKEGATLRVPKIPFLHWLQILSFYRDVHRKDTTEASVLYFWNHNNVRVPRAYAASEDGTAGREIKGVLEVGQLILYCPEQKNSGTLSDFQGDGMVNWLRQNTTGFCETHSHHTMGAFWSGTDNSNENMTQFYGVYGSIFQSNPAFLFRYVHGDDKTDIPMWELFEKPVTRVIAQVEIGDGQIIDVPDAANAFEFKGPWPAVAYPEDWMGQHSKNSYVGVNYGNGQGGYGAIGKGGAYGTGAAGYGGGAHTQRHTGAHGGAGHLDSEGDEDYFYARSERSYGRHQARPQVVELDTSKKKGVSTLEEISNLTNRAIVLRKTVDTPTSSVEIISTDHLSPWALQQVESLVLNLSEGGYDHFMMNLLKKLARAMG